MRSSYPSIPAIGQISRPVAVYLMTVCCRSDEIEHTVHRAMLGEKIGVQVGPVTVFVFRNHEFDNWWLAKEDT